MYEELHKQKTSSSASFADRTLEEVTPRRENLLDFILSKNYLSV